MLNVHWLVRFGVEPVDGQAVKAKGEHLAVMVVDHEMCVVRSTVLGS